MKILTKRDFFSIILCFCAIIPGAVVYSRLPDRVVTSWSMTSSETGTMPKPFAVFGIPLVFTVLTLIFCIYARKLERKQRTGKLAPAVQIGFPAVLYLTQSIILMYALGKLKNIGFVTCLFLSMFMLIFGNYAPKIRKNWFIGIRTPHNIKDDELWHKTHRLAGFTITAGGVLALAATLMNAFIAVFIIITAAILIPSVYAEVTYYRGKSTDK